MEEPPIATIFHRSHLTSRTQSTSREWQRDIKNNSQVSQEISNIRRVHQMVYCMFMLFENTLSHECRSLWYQKTFSSITTNGRFAHRYLVFRSYRSTFSHFTYTHQLAPRDALLSMLVRRNYPTKPLVVADNMFKGNAHSYAPPPHGYRNYFYGSTDAIDTTPCVLHASRWRTGKWSSYYMSSMI